MTAGARPLLVYDGDCAFCRRALTLWRRVARGRVDDLPAREAAALFPEVPLERFREALHLRHPDGSWSRGAGAVFHALAFVPGHGLGLWFYRRVPGFAAASEWGYRLVARHRRGLDRVLGGFVREAENQGSSTTRDTTDRSPPASRAK